MLTSLFGDLGAAKDPGGKKHDDGDEPEPTFAATAIMESVATEVNDRGQMVDRHLRDLVVSGSKYKYTTKCEVKDNGYIYVIV